MDEPDWLRHLLPLPRRVAIRGSVTCRPGAVRVAVASPADDILSEAAGLLEDRCGPSPSAPALTITLARAADVAHLDVAARLRDLPHPDQAYAITCPTDAAIVIAGTASTGVLYGATTLAQLLDVARTPTCLEVPLPEIVDFPAFDERGLWNFPDAAEWIPWMASLKLNYGKMAATVLAPAVRGEPGRAAIDASLQARARRHAFRYVPYILHLNFLHEIDLFRAWPELAGKGDGALAGRYIAHKEGNQHRAPCASQPVLVDLLADWMGSIAEQGADEISCWLSERPCQCGCQRCTPVGQFLLETRAFLAAWQRTRVRFPGLAIRIFSSTTTPQQDDRILAELPSAVKFERACATAMERVRHLPRDLFANPLLDDAAGRGRWLASYDVPIGAFGNVDTPEFKVPQFSAQRIRDFVGQLQRRRYAAAYGMLAWATQARRVCGFAIQALAEYTWNPDGRSARAFAEAWATREGLADPASVGAWADELGEVEFDVYDSDFPMGYSWGRVADAVEAGRPPRFGEGLFRHYRGPEDFDAKEAACLRARGRLDAAAHGDLLRSTDVVHSYVVLARALWCVAHGVAHADLASPADQRVLAADLEQLERAGAANVAALRAWRAGLGPEPWHHRVYDAIAGTQDTVARITRHLRHRHLR